jgi:hypothetical protein
METHGMMVKIKVGVVGKEHIGNHQGHHDERDKLRNDLQERRQEPQGWLQ